MFKKIFKANNSRFGKILSEVIKTYNISISSLRNECRIQNQRLVNIKKG